MEFHLRFRRCSVMRPTLSSVCCARTNALQWAHVGESMNRTPYLRQVVLLTLVSLITAGFAFAQSPHGGVPMHRIASVPVPGISGDFDHFAVDEKGGRLFLAGEDHKTLEVFDLQTGRHIKSVAGFGTPHSIFYLPDSDQILVTDGGAGVLQILSGK